MGPAPVAPNSPALGSPGQTLFFAQARNRLEHRGPTLLKRSLHFGGVEKYIWYTCIQNLPSVRLLGTTVRVREEDKEKLERLRAMATLASGQKVSQEELLGAVLDDALSHGESFLAESFGERRTLTGKEFEKLLDLISDWGVETGSGEIDEVLYGKPVRRRRN